MKQEHCLIGTSLLRDAAHAHLDCLLDQYSLFRARAARLLREGRYAKALPHPVGARVARAQIYAGLGTRLLEKILRITLSSACVAQAHFYADLGCARQCREF